MGGRFMVLNAIFNNISIISWWSVLLEEETRVPGENHWPAESHWQTSSHNVGLYTATKTFVIASYFCKMRIKILYWSTDGEFILSGKFSFPYRSYFSIYLPTLIIRSFMFHYLQVLIKKKMSTKTKRNTSGNTDLQKVGLSSRE